MGLGTDARMVVKAELSNRIDRLAMELPHMSPSMLAFAVDDIRRTAANHDLRPARRACART